MGKMDLHPNDFPQKCLPGIKRKTKDYGALRVQHFLRPIPPCVRQAGRLAVFGLARRCWGLAGNTIQRFSLSRADGSAQFLQGTKK